MSGGTSGVRTVVGGIVAFDDDDRVGPAIDSLTSQELPEDVRMDRIWVVAGGRTTTTVEVARERATRDPRIVVIEETVRRGKSAALGEILRRAEGDFVVLLNGDAFAAPGAVARVLEAAPPSGGLYGVMARPVVPEAPRNWLDRALAMLWGLHHRFHVELAERDEGSHLSDELFAFPTEHLPPFGPGIITDGAYAGAWIRSQGGTLIYAPQAEVRLSLPAGMADHLEQRRRIYVGHRQVVEISGQVPTTLGSLFFRDPRRVRALLRAELRATPKGRRAFALLLTLEAMAYVLSRWDLATRRRYAIWPRVLLAGQEPVGESQVAGTPG